MTDTEKSAKQWHRHRMVDNRRCRHHAELFDLLGIQLRAATEAAQHSMIDCGGYGRRIGVPSILHMQQMLIGFLFVRMMLPMPTRMRMWVIVVAVFAVRHFPVKNRIHCSVRARRDAGVMLCELCRLGHNNNFAFNHNVIYSSITVLELIEAILFFCFHSLFAGLNDFYLFDFFKIYLFEQTKKHIEAIVFAVFENTFCMSTSTTTKMRIANGELEYELHSLCPAEQTNQFLSVRFSIDFLLWADVLARTSNLTGTDFYANTDFTFHRQLSRRM